MADPDSLVVPACPICDGTQWSVVYEELPDRLLGVPGMFTLRECGTCGVWRLWPVPQNLSDHYPSEYRGRIGALVDVGAIRPWHHMAWSRSFDCSPRIRRTARRALRHNELAQLLWSRLEGRRSAPVSMLDYGAGNGRALLLARQLGMRAVGVDFSSHSLDRAKASGLDFRVGTYEDLPLGDERFDVVNLCHVLEHLVDPVQALANLKPHLAGDGSLVVSVPNAASGPSRLFGRDWHALDVPRHLWDFTPSSLTRVLERAGYEVESLVCDGAGGSIYQSIRYAMEESGDMYSLPDGQDPEIAAGLDALAAYWNARSVGDAMTIVGRIPA